ncbi:MAG: hypothetical protein U9O82_06295 [Thermodesulfobacteriota bacterium]|nr:hypothetical protein [Thermodesulfobacteriota bacterium]
MHGSIAVEDDLTLEIQVPISPPVPAQIREGLPRSLGHWGVAEIRLRFKHFVWIEELIEMVENVTSHNLCWPEEPPDPSQNNHLSVEKLAKAIGNKLADSRDISWFAVTVENLSEGFSTFASLEGPE